MCLLQFNLEVRANVNTVTKVNTFLSELNDSVGCTSLYRVEDQTEHKTLVQDKENRQPVKKHQCEAKLNFSLDNPISKCKEERKMKENFPIWLNLHYNIMLR